MQRRSRPVKLVLLSLLGSVVLSPLPGHSSTNNLGIFEGHSDVGTTLKAGEAQYDPASKTYRVHGSGENMWLTNDAFQFLWKKTSGDVSITAEVQFPKAGGNPHRKAALLFRQNLDPDAVYVDAALHGSGLTALQYRSAKGDVTGDIEFNYASITEAPQVLRIEKRGDYVSLSTSSHGEPLHASGATMRVKLTGEFYVGLGVCSHDKETMEEVVFSHVSIEPLPAVTGDKPVLHSMLQTISVDPSARRAEAVYTAAGHFEAPNWSRDGKDLFFDQQGRIMTVPLAGGSPKALETGAVANCNGSHGLSPDGKWLAISCSPKGGAGSQVYMLPSSGGTPRLVTENPSSYFHSWSPDGKTIAFTRPHPGGGDIFSISIEGGQETRLTTTTGISDDPDYSRMGNTFTSIQIELVATCKSGACEPTAATQSR